MPAAIPFRKPVIRKITASVSADLVEQMAAEWPDLAKGCRGTGTFLNRIMQDCLEERRRERAEQMRHLHAAAVEPR